MASNDERLSLRVPPGTTERGAALAEVLSELPNYRGLRVEASTALRLALLAGLELLEQQHELGEARRKRR